MTLEQENALLKQQLEAKDAEIASLKAQLEGKQAEAAEYRSWLEDFGELFESKDYMAMAEDIRGVLDKYRNPDGPKSRFPFLDRCRTLEKEVAELKAQLEGASLSSRNIIDQNCRLLEERDRLQAATIRIERERLKAHAIAFRMYQPPAGFYRTELDIYKKFIESLSKK